MASRTVKIMNVVAAGQAVNADSQPIAAGKTIRLKKLILSEQNLGDNKSSGVLVQWGSNGSFEELAAGYVTGNTIEIQVDEDRVGDGVKFLRITRQNNSAQQKRIMAWLTVVEL